MDPYRGLRLYADPEWTGALPNDRRRPVEGWRWTPRRSHPLSGQTSRAGVRLDALLTADPKFRPNEESVEGEYAAGGRTGKTNRRRPTTWEIAGHHGPGAGAGWSDQEVVDEEEKGKPAGQTASGGTTRPG